MKRDPIVIGKDYILEGTDVGRTRPNANALIVGITGCGKSMSIILPTVGRMEHSNPVLSYAKPSEAYRMANYLTRKGYKVHILDIDTPANSTDSFDPVLSFERYEDIMALADCIIDSTLKTVNDDYWSLKAKDLLISLICATLMLSEPGEEPGMLDVLERFGRFLPVEASAGNSSSLDEEMKLLENACPDCLAVREYRNVTNLPLRTCECIRDTLASGLSSFFTEPIRQMMREKPQLDIQSFARGKEAILVITNATEPIQAYYSNLFYREMERRLLKYAHTLPEGELPREVRFIFDDFACTAAINGFETDISLFRSAGLSAIMLLQSEYQLEAIYKEAAPIIRQNCAVYAYFPGGFDDRSCEIVSKRMCLPYDDILYAPLGKVFVMHSGTRPMSIPRYDIFHSREYQEYMEANRRDGRVR